MRKWFGLKPEEGSTIIVYASGSVKAVIGEFRVGRVFFAKPGDIWSILSTMENIGVGAEDYQYIRGAKKALAIEVVDPVLYVKPITLDEIRNIIPRFNPPMSFRELSVYEPLYEVIIRKARELTYELLRRG